MSYFKVELSPCRNIDEIGRKDQSAVSLIYEKSVSTYFAFDPVFFNPEDNAKVLMFLKKLLVRVV